jgi:hypothetical protein
MIAYVDEVFRSGKFYDWMQEALDNNGREAEPVLLDIQFRLLPVSFLKFKHILETMLALERSPYRIALAQNQVRFLVDDFIESTVNADQARSHLQRSDEIETSWRFYGVPRSNGYASSYEIDYAGPDAVGLYKQRGNKNTDNYLANYFYSLVGDAFLVFHNDHKVFFLLTNGSD